MTKQRQTECESAYNALVANRITAFIGMPDSLLAPLFTYISGKPDIEYIPTTHEAVAIGIAAGMTLAGRKCLVAMENSGVRAAFETLTRLSISHHLFVCMLLSDRGGFGERNWWGVPHSFTSKAVLELLRIVNHPVENAADFNGALVSAYATLAAGQCSVALVATHIFTERLAQG